METGQTAASRENDSNRSFGSSAYGRGTSERQTPTPGTESGTEVGKKPFTSNIK
jgi:hypothetical protein